MSEVLTVKITPKPMIAAGERLKSLRLPLKHAVRAWRAVGRSEFNNEQWRPPGGGTKAWKRVLPFPAFGQKGAETNATFGPPTAVLQKTGNLRRAWLGGSGSIERISRTKATFGISTKYGHIHRGGTGRVTQASASHPELVPVTRKMRMFLGRTRGLWLRGSTTHIKIPRRPHFTKNPEVVRRIKLVFAAHASGARAPVEVLK